MKINYEGIEIEFQAIYRKRKTLKISVKPDCTVEVVVPSGIKEEYIKEIVLKRAQWILKKREYFEKNSPRTILMNYVSGESHRYLGNEYKINIVFAKKNSVILEKSNIYIYSQNSTDGDYNKKLLYKWYRENAEIEFGRLFEECFKKFTEYNFTKPTWSIRKMKRRWGSYRPYKNHVTLNLELIKEEKDLIEYVIIHELCHIKHPNHSRRFYEFMDEILPKWRERKKRLL
ncbi:SprT family zinc-dependent metalloprotease [Clostridium sp. MB40-C1]|uniref:M48 family metallopeptidase n=1 Tax=Clostridium sp. MB40-C1 TaxID=3070996 RepID=UPI0027E202F9|nr:SprT family zinc-dependent metalloprotease [Clostridium sp. MB40-C1]WMJ82219.1 SprT family zinc-dependent metalloprotease [Clostridium sp. MB40-C1]